MGLLFWRKVQYIQVGTGTDRFDFEIVGESQYQPALRRVAAATKANELGDQVFPVTLRREPRNPHDPHAIAVLAYGQEVVGYFSRVDAEFHCKAIDALGKQVATCNGVLRGGQPGRPSYGVWLDFEMRMTREDVRALAQRVTAESKRKP